jgi:iron complex outermembrane receptor protein
VAGAAAAWPGPATAQSSAPPSEENADAFTLGEIVVTARARDGALIGGAAIDGEALRSFDRRTLDRALDLIPGANGATTGGSRNERLVFIRGFDRFQTTLSIDGVRVFLPADNRIDFGRFLTADLSQVQVSKGYVSVLDGPGGVGGAINLVTRKPSRAFELEGIVTASLDGDVTPNGHTVSGRIGARQERFYVQASGAASERNHWALSRDFTPTVLENGGYRDRSSAEDWRFNVKAGWAPNSNDEYALSYLAQSGARNAPLHITDTASTRFWDWPYWDLTSLYFLSQTSLVDRLTIKSRVYQNTFENALFAYDDARQATQTLPRAFRSYYDDVAYGANVQAVWDVTDANTLQLALHWREDEHRERQDGVVRVPPTGAPFVNRAFAEPWQTTREATYSIAAENTLAVTPSLDVIAGASYDWTDLKRAEDISMFATGGALNIRPVSYPLNDMDAVNGQAALSWRQSAALRWRLSVSSRTRFPTLFDRFSSRFGLAVPNPSVRPERATNVEIGIGFKPSAAFDLDAAIFTSELTDALIQVPVAFGGAIGTVNQTRNVGSGTYRGLETALTWKAQNTLTLGANYTYLDRDLTDPTNPAFRPQGVPTHKLFAFADWRVNDAVTLTPSLDLASDRWTVTSSSLIAPPRFFRTGSYAMLNLAAAWRISDQADIVVSGRNLNDENYQLVEGFPEEGRKFSVSVRLRN